MCEIRDANMLIDSEVSINKLSTLISDDGEAGGRLGLSLHVPLRVKYPMERRDINLLTSLVSHVTPSSSIFSTDTVI